MGGVWNQYVVEDGTKVLSGWTIRGFPTAAVETSEELSIIYGPTHFSLILDKEVVHKMIHDKDWDWMVIFELAGFMKLFMIGADDTPMMSAMDYMAQHKPGAL